MDDIHQFFTVGEQPFPLPAYFTAYGKEMRSTIDYRYDGMKRGTDPQFIWQYTLRGHGWLRMGPEGERPPVRVDPGMAMCLLVPSEHCYFFEPDTPGAFWEFCYFDINGPEGIRLGKRFIEQHGMLVKLQNNGETLACLNRFIHMASLGQMTSRYTNCSECMAFLMALFRECAQESMAPSSVVQRIQEYCLNHLDEPLDEAGLARKSGYSKYHFSRLFKQEAGMSLPQFIAEQRIRRAVTLLRSTERYTIKETATECGFDNCSYFCKIFKQILGVTPQQFRTGNS